MLDVDTGVYNITAIATDNMGAISVSPEIEIRVEDINDVNSEFIKLYPNPNNGQFTLDLGSESPVEQSYRIIIVNLSGQTIHNEPYADPGYPREFDLSSYSSGTYILTVTSGKEIISTKTFIKK
ncbi:MAG: T9SS type A sorting domain-containing protein, partial [Bacteroidales bacterium]|nr:T9SS type A sorting domain-containing protein [Bacteroidales bacterium]